MSIASVSGRLRAERQIRKSEAENANKPRKVWPELSQEERERIARIDEDVLRYRGGRLAAIAKAEGA